MIAPTGKRALSSKPIPLAGTFLLLIAAWQPPSLDAQTSAPSPAASAEEASAGSGSDLPAPEIDLGEGLWRAPWYDPETKQIRPIEIPVREDDSIHRDSRWLPKPKKLKKPDKPNPTSPTTNTTGTNAGGLFGSSLTLGNLFGWIVLLTILLATIGAIVFAITRAEMQMGSRAKSDQARSGKGALPDQQTLERIKHLPPELRRTDVNLRSECERLMNEERFDQAIILLLGHQLLLLDKHGMLRLNRGKTNGRYVRETRTHSAVCSRLLRETADAFEQSYFGRHEIPAEVFAQLWAQNSELETVVEKTEARG